MQVLFLVSVQLPVSSLGWPQFALWIDDCDPSLHQSDKKIDCQKSLVSGPSYSIIASSSTQRKTLLGCDIMF
jgi:hypothetical protein